MGFETELKIEIMEKGKNLNFVPMGFETALSKKLINLKKNLNFVPMGFETPNWEFLLY